MLDAGHTGMGGGFLGGMTNDKYAKITGASKATATRDLTDLLRKGLLDATRLLPASPPPPSNKHSVTNPPTYPPVWGCF